VPVEHRITWDEFRKAFRDHHIPKSVLKLKGDEFCKLKQGNKSVQGYTNAFNYLSQYAPHDVDDDEKKQDCYMEGLSLKLKAQHSNIDFKDFNDLLRKSIKAEYNLNALEVNNRKRAAPSSWVVVQALNVRARAFSSTPDSEIWCSSTDVDGTPSSGTARATSPP
jgi:hypothetical protein